jgi:ABC-type protease/lipase transport system fused ATPase/permease subunit
MEFDGEISPSAAGSRREKSRLQKFFASSRQADESIELEWSNINYSMLVKDAAKSKFCNTVYKRKDILKNVSGKATSGQLLAIMGPTGSHQRYSL